jgi:hypothetical protein
MEELALYFQKRSSPSEPLYPIRVLKYNNLCIDESQSISSPPTDVLPGSTSPVDTRSLDATQQSELNALLAAHAAFMEAKQVYESCVQRFWNSQTGALCASLLSPDPPAQDRDILYTKIKGLEARLQKDCLSVKRQTVEISGYNRIVAKYIVTMFETQDPPRLYDEFVLYTWKSRTIEEIPKLWTNKMALERKKEMELVYVFGQLLPPYRLHDMKIAC